MIAAEYFAAAARRLAFAEGISEEAARLRVWVVLTGQDAGVMDIADAAAQRAIVGRTEDDERAAIGERTG